MFKKQPSKGPEQQGSSNGAPSPSSAAAGSPAEDQQLDPQLEASIRMNVERANQTLQEIVQVTAESTN